MNENNLGETLKGEEKVKEQGGSLGSEIIVPVPETRSKKLSFYDILNRLSPGKSLRIALDDILEGKSGALIAVDCLALRELIDGGFRINCRFTSQKLSELAKMDGAIVVSDDLSRILFANVLLVPNKDITTEETGTRHKAAERIAKQAQTAVIAVSERRNKITLFYDDRKHIVEDSENVLRRATETLNILEKQKEIFDELLKNFNVLEITKLVSVADVCNLLQRIEVILKMLETMKKYLNELGNQGVIIRMRVREMFKGLEQLEDSIIRDYSPRAQNMKRVLSSITFEGMIDTEGLSRMLFELSPDSSLNPKGYRLLDKLKLTDKEMKALILNFNGLSGIMDASIEDLAKILKAKKENFKKELENLKEQILMGKKI